ncbi:MAG: lactate racemase domain-containing protein [Spirochaetaceae bacterium]|jgi:nickel-dependent lactate racemase|nr:lactate racemase domain-containing protein [Spirochaetaceae bacterium]
MNGGIHGDKTYVSRGGKRLDLSDRELASIFTEALSRALTDLGDPGPVLILPPDGTRQHSRAGMLTDIACRELEGSGKTASLFGGAGSGWSLGAVMPALGTHTPMTSAEIRDMFPQTPPDKFLSHDWRRDVVELGRIEADWVAGISSGAVAYDWPVQVNRRIRDGGFSLVISIGQVAPHEVVGMANHDKNIFVGIGGKEAIDKSHFLGAAYGMERIIGRVDTPVRALFDEGRRRFGNQLPPVLWVLTVVSLRNDTEAAAAGKARGSPAVRGLFVGFGRDCFERAAALAQEVNVDIPDERIQKAVVYLDPGEYRSTWLGNKAIYRTRMALEDQGELLILAPGLQRFGEDPALDRIIRKHGYRPGAVIKDRISRDEGLAGNLSAAAHLIHGSAEGRFTVRYCPGPGLSRAEIESVGYEWGNYSEAAARYDVQTLRFGWNTLPDGERIFFIVNPALGLWIDGRRLIR